MQIPLANFSRVARPLVKHPLINASSRGIRDKAMTECVISPHHLPFASGQSPFQMITCFTGCDRSKFWRIAKLNRRQSTDKRCRPVVRQMTGRPASRFTANYFLLLAEEVWPAGMYFEPFLQDIFQS